MSMFASDLPADDEAALQRLLDRKLKGVPKKIREQQDLTLRAILTAYNPVMPFDP